MKRLVVFAMPLVFLVLLLSGCNETPLLAADYDRLEVVKGAKLVFSTSEAPEIERILKRINGSPREDSSTWELPEPIGFLSLYVKGQNDGITLPLYNNGILVKGYFVETEFDF